MLGCACRADDLRAEVLGQLCRERFGELRRRLDGITQTMLTRTVRTLERDGLVTRTVYTWSEENINAVLDARGAYNARAAQEVQPVTT